MTRPQDHEVDQMPHPDPITPQPAFWPARCLAALVLLGLASSVQAQENGSFGDVIRIELDAFKSDAGTITFSELPAGTHNPVFHPSTYGAPENGVLVGFAGYFEGQSPGRQADCPPGAKLSGCVSGQPSAPLRLASNGPYTMIAPDGSNPHSPSLSGSPLFNGPVSFVFDKDVAGVGLAGGFFNAVQTTAITAFDRQGHLIGGVRNLRTGMDYMALVTTDGSDRIAGIQFSLVGAEHQGFGIDDLTFALSSQLNREKIKGIAPAEPAVQPQPLPPPLNLLHRCSASSCIRQSPQHPDPTKEFDCAGSLSRQCPAKSA